MSPRVSITWHIGGSCGPACAACSSVSDPLSIRQASETLLSLALGGVWSISFEGDNLASLDGFDLMLRAASELGIVTQFTHPVNLDLPDSLRDLCDSGVTRCLRSARLNCPRGPTSSLEIPPELTSTHDGSLFVTFCSHSFTELLHRSLDWSETDVTLFHVPCSDDSTHLSASSAAIDAAMSRLQARLQRADPEIDESCWISPESWYRDPSGAQHPCSEATSLVAITTPDLPCKFRFYFSDRLRAFVQVRDCPVGGGH